MVKRTAFITGASQGLGKSMTRHLVEAGIGVVGTYMPGDGDAGALEGSFGGAAPVRMLPLDLRDTKSFPALKADLAEVLRDTFARERLDYVVQNAGIDLMEETTEITEEQLDQLYRTDLKGPLLLNQALLPMIEDGGRIINLSSAATRFYIKGHGSYAAMKAGVEVLTLYMATELGGRGIRVNAVAPGAIETGFADGEVRDNKEINQMFKDATPLGRVGQADDIGAIVRALVSDDMAWLNGQRIEVSGGQSL